MGFNELASKIEEALKPLAELLNDIISKFIELFKETGLLELAAGVGAASELILWEGSYISRDNAIAVYLPSGDVLVRTFGEYNWLLRIPPKGQRRLIGWQ